jgi:hypothetical protein
VSLRETIKKGAKEGPVKREAHKSKEMNSITQRELRLCSRVEYNQGGV